MKRNTESTIFCECELPEDQSGTAPLCQGDVLEWLPRQVGAQTPFAIVVTANCDLALDKHAGIVSYVPVYTLANYAAQFILPGQLENGITPIMAEFVSLVRKMQAANCPDFPNPLSELAIKEWLHAASPEEIANTLHIKEAKNHKKLVELATAIRQVHRARDLGTFESQSDALIALRVRAGNPLPKARTRFREDLGDRIRKLPGDAFYFNAISSEHCAGYVAYLRLVRELRAEQIALRPRDLSTDAVMARRVARLNSPFLYRLTQQLGDVFASIGLPTAYEAERARMVDSLPMGDSDE